MSDRSLKTGETHGSSDRGRSHERGRDSHDNTGIRRSRSRDRRNGSHHRGSPRPDSQQAALHVLPHTSRLANASQMSTGFYCCFRYSV